jgi:hypothetical protein
MGHLVEKLLAALLAAVQCRLLVDDKLPPSSVETPIRGVKFRPAFPSLETATEAVGVHSLLPPVGPGDTPARRLYDISAGRACARERVLN